eukprot:4833291-Pleurochrysis_carterae.AAC.2
MNGTAHHHRSSPLAVHTFYCIAQVAPHIRWIAPAHPSTTPLGSCRPLLFARNEHDYNWDAANCIIYDITQQEAPTWLRPEDQCTGERKAEYAINCALAFVRSCSVRVRASKQFKLKRQHEACRQKMCA